MNSDYRSEMRGFLLITCFVVVVPLILFPRDLGIKLNLSTFLLVALELGWYAIILFIMFPKESASKVLPLAVITLGYRVGLGIGFAVLLLAMFSLPVGSAVRLGIHQYAPAFVLQAIMSPFVLRSMFEVFLRNRRVSRGARVVGFEQDVREAPVDTSSEITEDQAETKKPVSWEREPKMSPKAGLEGILHYLKEYAGVRSVLLVDPEGLVVACDPCQNVDAERIASFSRLLKDSNDQVLHAMGEGTSERIAIHTPDVWMCFHQIGDFTLVVLSERRTDELLWVRIMQSTAMIEKFLAEKHQQNRAKAVEA